MHYLIHLPLLSSLFVNASPFNKIEAPFCKFSPLLFSSGSLHRLIRADRVIITDPVGRNNVTLQPRSYLVKRGPGEKAMWFDEPGYSAELRQFVKLDFEQYATNMRVPTQLMMESAQVKWARQHAANLEEQVLKTKAYQSAEDVKNARLAKEQRLDKRMGLFENEEEWKKRVALLNREEEQEAELSKALTDLRARGIVIDEAAYKDVLEKGAQIVEKNVRYGIAEGMSDVLEAEQSVLSTSVRAGLTAQDVAMFTIRLDRRIRRTRFTCGVYSSGVVPNLASLIQRRSVGRAGSQQTTRGGHRCELLLASDFSARAM